MHLTQLVESLLFILLFVSSAVQLWTMGNYHWYLKQSLDFGRDPQKAPICVCWDPERPLKLHLIRRNWITVTYEWGWTTERSPGLDSTDNANVAVIDGGEGLPVSDFYNNNKKRLTLTMVSFPPDKILLTTFRHGVVPPPMCSFELQLKVPVNQVTFLCRPQRTNQMAAYTANGQICIFSQGGLLKVLS